MRMARGLLFPKIWKLLFARRTKAYVSWLVVLLACFARVFAF